MINAIKRAFGVSESYSYAEFDEVEKEEKAPATAETSEIETPAAPGDEETGLLDAILNIVNASLPPLVSESIDRERQRARLYETLGDSFTLFAAAMRRKAISELTGDRAKMQTELDELRAERKEVASKREEQKANLLSEQRQRRALQERNRDLETKISELDAEIEQHKLTISSLMNKIRVAEVSEGDVTAIKESYEARIETLNAKLEAKEAETVELSARIAELESPLALSNALEQRREMTDGADEPSVAEAAEPQPKKQRRKRRKPASPQGEPSAELAELESVDWLLPGGVPAGHTPPGPDPDFGYQPPRTIPEPDSDAQLTLF